MPRFLALDKLGIEYVGGYPEGEIWLNENVRIHHGQIVRGESGKTVAVVTNDLRHTEIFGHIHRIEMAMKTNWSYGGAKSYAAWSFGCLCSLLPGRVPGFKPRQNWQQGIGIVEFEEGNGLFNITPIPIYDGVAIYDGVKFVARDESEIIEQMESETKFRLRAA